LLRAGDGYALAVLASTSRDDLDRVARLLGVESATLATEDEVQAVFADCERGALPPFGRLYGLRTIVDSGLAGGSEIVCVGNSRHEGLRLHYRDYQALETPLGARFATPFRTDGNGNPSRRAG
jgi:Ala-tRNA(Pro) deacylase